MTSLRLTSLGAALALTVLAGAGAAHAAVPASVPTAWATGQTSAPLAAASPASAAVPDFSDGYGLSVLREETQVHSPTDFTTDLTGLGKPATGGTWWGLHRRLSGGLHVEVH